LWGHQQVLRVRLPRQMTPTIVAPGVVPCPRLLANLHGFLCAHPPHPRYQCVRDV
jgi:hypothetical protein